MSEEFTSQEFRLKKKEKAINYYIKEIEMIYWRIIKKKIFVRLDYIEHFLTLISVVVKCISISAFACLVDILTRIMRSSTVLNIYAMTAIIKKYNSVVNKTVKEARWNSIGIKN